MKFSIFKGFCNPSSKCAICYVVTSMYIKVKNLERNCNNGHKSAFAVNASSRGNLKILQCNHDALIWMIFALCYIPCFYFSAIFCPRTNFSFCSYLNVYLSNYVYLCSNNLL